MQRPSAGRDWNLFKDQEQVCVAELGGAGGGGGSEHRARGGYRDRKRAVIKPHVVSWYIATWEKDYISQLSCG